METPPESTYTSPVGWVMAFVPVEGESVGLVEWNTSDPTRMIAGGESRLGFAVRIPTNDSSYVVGHWTVSTSSIEEPYFTGSLVDDAIVGVHGTSLDTQERIRITPIPSAGATHMRFSLLRPEKFSASVFDIQGRLVKNLAAGAKGRSGSNDLAWDGKNQSGRAVASGTYFVRVKTPGEDLYARIVIVR